MPTQRLKPPAATPGQILKRLIKGKEGLTQDRAARRAGVGLKQLWRIFVGERFLDEDLAKRIIDGCGLEGPGADELLAAVQEAQLHPKPLEKGAAAQNFGRFLADCRRKASLSTRRLAAECKLKQPNLVAVETGRAVPSPLLATQLALMLPLSPQEAADYFRLLGDALREHSAVSQVTTAPALCALSEWLLYTLAPKTAESVSVGLPEANLPNAYRAVARVKAALAEVGRQFEAAVQQQPSATTASLPVGGCIRHPDGTATLLLSVAVPL